MSEYPQSSVEIKYLLERIERLERQAALQRSYSFPQQVRLAKTVQNPDISDPKYPLSGNTFPFIFVEGDFPGAPGAQTATYDNLDSASPPNPHGHCHNITGEYIPEDTIVKLTKHVGQDQDIGDGEWWAERAYANSMCEYRTSYGKDETYTESDVTRHRWHDRYSGNHDGLDCGLYDANGYANNTLQSSSIGSGSWFWKYIFGDPEAVGIKQDEDGDIADIFLDGNFDVLKDGHYQFELNVNYYLNWVHNNSVYGIQYESANTGVTSSHSHTYLKPPAAPSNIASGIYFMRKDDTGTNATYHNYTDEVGNTRGQAKYFNAAFFSAFSSNADWITTPYVFTANLSEGERIAFRPYASWLAKYQVYDCYMNIKCDSLKITNLGAKRTPVDLTA